MLTEQGLLTRSPGHRAYTTSSLTSVLSIGILAGFREEPFARMIILEGMKEAIASKRFGFSTFAGPATELDSYLDSEPMNGAEPLGGLILLPPSNVDRARLREFRRKRPIVLIDQMIPGFEADFVGFQDFEAGYDAARHLYELGHRRIAFLGNEVPGTARDRRRGVEAFCQDAGIEATWNFSGLTNGSGVPDGYLQSVFGLVRQAWPTAAVCSNDETAAKMIVGLGRLGIKVPGDLALVGFGNADTSLLSALDLSTMAQPYVDVGREALNLIAGRIRGTLTGDPKEIRLPMHFVRRGSCGAAISSTAA